MVAGRPEGVVRLGGPRGATRGPAGAAGLGWPRSATPGLVGAVGWPERAAPQRRVGSAGRAAPGDPVGRAPLPGCRWVGAGWGSVGVRRDERAEPTCVPGRPLCGAAERSGPAGSRRRPPRPRRRGRLRARSPEHPGSSRRPRPRHRRGRSPRRRVPRAPARRRRPVGWALAGGSAGRPGQASRGAGAAVRRWAGRAGSAVWVGPGGQVGRSGGVGPPGAAKPAERAPALERVRLGGLLGRRARPMPSGTQPASLMDPVPPAGSMEGWSGLRPPTAGVRRLAGVAWPGGWVARPGRAEGWLGWTEAGRGSRGGLPPRPGPT